MNDILIHDEHKNRGRLRTHGSDKSTEYNSWRAMRARCTNQKLRSYSDYGARGITVCKEWDSFETFLLDMGRKPSPSHSIERIENDKGYYKSNCKWATKIEQARNMSNNRKTEYRGVEYPTISSLAEATGCCYTMLLQRISRWGWTTEDAVNRPNQNQKRLADSKVEIDTLHFLRSKGISKTDCAKYFGTHLRVIQRLLLPAREA